MAVNVDLSNVPYLFSEGGKKILADLEAFEDPEIVKSVGGSVEKLAAVSSEDAVKFLPSIYRNQFFMANEMCDIGRAVCDTAKAVTKIDRKAGLALLAGCAALGVGYYLYTRIKKQDARINILEQTIAQMNSEKSNVIGF